ncbi:unnamed protein product [Symbiodinium sp. CCMP2592]|nr:unnamed protein product [Symbiodinium sp. CCMP2592]
MVDMLSEAVPVLFTAQIARKKPVWREGRLHFARGSAVLLDEVGQRLEATPADGLQKRLKQGGEFRLERHKILLEPSESVGNQQTTSTNSEVLLSPQHVSGASVAAPFRAPRSTTRLLHAQLMKAAVQDQRTTEDSHAAGKGEQPDVWLRCAVAAEKAARRESEGTKKQDLWEAASREEALVNKFRRIWYGQPEDVL